MDTEWKGAGLSSAAFVSEDIPHLHVEGNQISRRPRAIIIKYAGCWDEKESNYLETCLLQSFREQKLATIFYFKL